MVGSNPTALPSLWPYRIGPVIPLMGAAGSQAAAGICCIGLGAVGLILLVKKEQEDMEEVVQLISGRVRISSRSCFMHRGGKKSHF